MTSQLQGTKSSLIFTPELTSLSKDTFIKFSSHPQKQHLSQSDFRSICESLELYFSNEKFSSLWQKLCGRSKTMSFNAFESFLVFWCEDCNEMDELRQTFNVLDANHDGKIDWRDLDQIWNGIMASADQQGGDTMAEMEFLSSSASSTRRVKTRQEIQNIISSLRQYCGGGEEDAKKRSISFTEFCRVMKGKSGTNNEAAREEGDESSSK